MNTYLGNAIILPPQMLGEVRNLSELDFWPAVEKPKTQKLRPQLKDHHGYLPGFEPFKANYEGPTMINKQLTKSLNKHTKPIYQEAKLAVDDLLTKSSGTLDA
ncbi:trichothecene c-8 hydroxylase [Colletotrichum incanum]|uniref:Trichothecene c-8 hydroxylase n=1 Tax=Colletotrichum incanum TaxID=1573173 RepID=A0A166WMB4_COLIC|nr:trichothecene c-8 hydroxylase [Colletotrichum incanum]